jgi:hypothetical protein
MGLPLNFPFGEGNGTMDKAIKAYLDRASEIIGHRTSSETVYDDMVVEALNHGHTIKEALAIAGEKHPDEALRWDESNITGIAARYDYLKEHARIIGMLRKRKKR